MMSLSNMLQWLNPRARRAERARSELKANAEKALRMKQEAGVHAQIPEHQTSHDGSVKGQQMSMTDRDAGSQGSYTPQLKRSRVARSGDT